MHPTLTKRLLLLGAVLLLLVALVLLAMGDWAGAILPAVAAGGALLTRTFPRRTP